VKDEFGPRVATATRSAGAVQEPPANELAAELIATRRRLEAALVTARMAYWDCEGGSDRVVASRSMDQLYGLPDGERFTSRARGLQIAHPQDRVWLHDVISQATEQGEGWHTEFRIIRPRDGRIAWLEERATVMRDAETDRHHTTAMVWDVSERKQAEQALERARSEAEKMRDERLEHERRGREAAEALMAVMSHELRTPVTSIRGTAALLGRNPHRPDAGDLVIDIQEEADRLMRIIDDLMVLSGVDRGLLHMTFEPVLLRHLVPSVVADLHKHHPNVLFRIDIPAGTSAVAGDAMALRQVIYNLLSNAAKYAGSDGPVTVRVREVPDEVEVVVFDQGPGLGADPEALFDLFYREPGISARTTGSGIGLYVVRELLDAMGTTISARSRDEGGAEFRFRLPAVSDMEA
jgi:PAS domain S-box-containing protein